MALDPRISRVNPDGSYLYRDTIAKNSDGYYRIVDGTSVRVPGQPAYRIDINIERSVGGRYPRDNSLVTLTDIFYRYGYYDTSVNDTLPVLKKTPRRCKLFSDTVVPCRSPRGYGVRMYLFPRDVIEYPFQYDNLGYPLVCVNVLNKGGAFYRNQNRWTIGQDDPISYVVFPCKNGRVNRQGGFCIVLDAYYQQMWGENRQTFDLQYWKTIRKAFNTVRYNYLRDILNVREVISNDLIYTNLIDRGTVEV